MGRFGARSGWIWAVAIVMLLLGAEAGRSQPMRPESLVGIGDRVPTNHQPGQNPADGLRSVLAWRNVMRYNPTLVLFGAGWALLSHLLKNPPDA